MSRFSLALDSTQINSYLTCPEQWKRAHRDHLVPNYAKTEGRDKGTIMHNLLEIYYNAIKWGKPWQTAQRDALDKLDQACKTVKPVNGMQKEVEQRFILYTCTYVNS